MIEHAECERRVIEIAERGPFRMPDLVQELQDEAYEHVVRETVWKLVDKSALEYTIDRAFRKVE